MATIELKRARIPSDVLAHFRLKDNDVAISWHSLEEICVRAYSASQRAFAGECEAKIDAEDDTRLNVTYRGTQPQFPGVSDLVVFCKYRGRLKSYNVPIIYFVKSTEEVTGYQVIDDPELDVAISVEDTSEVSVHLEVEDVSTSLLDQAIEDAEAAADLANLKADEASSAAAGAAEAASIAREKAQAANSAAGRANAAATRANNAADSAIAAGQHQPKIGDNGNWFIWDVTEEDYIDTLVHAQGPQGDPGDPSGFGEVTAEVDDNVGTPSVNVETSGPDTAKNFHFAFSNLKGNKGEKGDTPEITADEDGTIYADGVVLTEVIKDAKTQAASDHSRAESDHERAEDDHESIADKADVDGWYSGMTVGLAENLIDTRGEGTDQEFLFRKACGDKSITDRGNALIQSIYGKTVVWNQLVQNGNFASGTTNWSVISGASGSSLSSSNNTATVTKVSNTNLGIRQSSAIIPAGHKILYHYDIYPHDYDVTTRFGYNNASSVVGTLTTSVSKDKWTTVIGIATAGAEGMQGLLIYGNAGNDANITTIDFRNVSCIDLTQMGIADIISTPADFEKWYNANYHAFNAGTLLSNKAAAIESRGFNQWDEETRDGYYNARTGEFTENASYTANKNNIPVIPGESYYIRSIQTVMVTNFWDSKGNFIASERRTSIPNNHIITIPANAAYFGFAHSKTMNSVSCINISDPAKNGTYEPYTLTTLHLDLTTLTGKVNGEGESVVIAPRGLEGAVAAFDKGLVENGYYSKVQKEVGHVVYDGSEDWKMTSGTFYLANAARKSGKLNIICSKYVTTTSSTETVSSLPDKMIMGADDSGRIYIKDSGCADASAFKAYLAAQYQAGTPLEMNFELDTPQVYVLDTPIPVTYAVENGGTERILPDGVDLQGVPATAPFNAKILYSTNFPREIANLPQNYISKESAVNLLEAFKSAGIISAYTMTFVNGVYTFTITA